MERRVVLAVVGEFSSGKSYLLNALLGGDELLATDINPSTATITELTYGTHALALAHYPSGRSERIPFGRLGRFVAVAEDGAGALHDATRDDDAAPERVTIELESPFLESGFLIADTPGLASLNPAHRRSTLGYLPRADAVLYLVDTQQPFGSGDAAFLALVAENVDVLFLIQTKIDLGRDPAADGRAAWEHARDRIETRARAIAPQVELFAVSARDRIAAVAADDADLDGASGIPALVAALESRLLVRARERRLDRAGAIARTVVREARARLDRETELARLSEPELLEERARAARDVASLESESDDLRIALASERDAFARAVASEGARLAQRSARIVTSMLDVADIAVVRDRERLHALADAALVPAWRAFGRALGERLEAATTSPRAAELAIAAFGGDPSAGSWSRGIAHGLAASTAIGMAIGPSARLVAAIGAEFAGEAPGAIMKRELGTALRAAILPAFARDLDGSVAALAESGAAAFRALDDALAGDVRDARAEALDPIARALERPKVPVLASHAAALAGFERRIAAMGASPGAAPPAHPRSVSPPGASGAVPAATAGSDGPAFDGVAYVRARPGDRYRVAVVGCLGRGKSTLVDALAETPVVPRALGDVRFPIAVGFADAARVEGSADGPIAVATPWKLPRALEFVRVPAFDSGLPNAEALAFDVACGTSEIVALFSRQLSASELAFFGRLAERGLAISFVHTHADNETARDRRSVVELARRYLAERGIAAERIYTVSARDEIDAAAHARPAAAWNELAALRESLVARAESDAARIARIRAAHPPSASEKPTVPKHRGFRRLFRAR